MADWIPVAVLPNLFTRRTVEGEIVALVPTADTRLQAFCAAHPQFKEFLARFTDTFNVPLDPVVFIARDDVIPKMADTQGPLLSFRDIVAISVVPHARSDALVYKNPDRISYSNSFWLHRWMFAKDNDGLAASTPAFAGFHLVEEFHGQSSPELPVMQLDKLDEPLFQALLARWKRHYLRKRSRWQDRALFRSLNMATQAAQLPAGMGTTLYDLGRIAALWVSAFEILAHPRTGKSGLRYVYPLLERVAYLDRKVGQKKYSAHMVGKKPWPRRPLPCWLYGRLYRGRNAFLHGNRVSPKTLQPGDMKVSLFWLAPSLYRLALTGALNPYLSSANCAKAQMPRRLPSLPMHEWISTSINISPNARFFGRASSIGSRSSSATELRRYLQARVILIGSVSSCARGRRPRGSVSRPLRTTNTWRQRQTWRDIVPDFNKPLAIQCRTSSST